MPQLLKGGSWACCSITIQSKSCFTSGGDNPLTEGAGCYRRPPGHSLKVGGEHLGIAGLEETIAKGLEHIGSPDSEQKDVLLSELKARNYVPSSVEKEYISALWTEYRKHRSVERDKLEDSYHGVPREEITWFPTVDRSRCSGCSSCVEFCAQEVFFFVEGKSHVVRPNNCIVGNSNCRSFCPEKAISFPSMTDLRNNIKKLREKHNIKP